MTDSEDELKQQRQRLLSEMEINQRLLLNAKTALEISGKPRDTVLRSNPNHWYLQTQTEIRNRGLTHQQFCRELSALNQEIRMHKDNNIEHNFVEKARKLLPPEVFDTIMSEALKLIIQPEATGDKMNVT